MKTSLLLSAFAVVWVGSAGLSPAADSKRTAEYLLSTPSEFEGKTVTVDVAAVQPTHWKSPFPELVFFHAMTLDRMDRKPGGPILVAVPAAEAAAFAKKYGTDFEGRYKSDPLKGQFLSSGPRRVWLIDVSGQLAKLQAERKVSVPEGDGGPGGFAGGPRPWKKGPGQP